MVQIQKNVSALVPFQFPPFYESEGPNFIAFVEAYYEWLEQKGQVASYSRSLLDIFDIDSTPEQFLQYYHDEYINSIPSNIVANPRLLMKHILDLYRSKGTKAAYQLLFRMVFNEDVDIFIPNSELFRSSAATWVVPGYIEVSDSPYLTALIGKQIYNAAASAVVESVSTVIINNTIVNVLYISSPVGIFRFGQPILCNDLYVDSFGDLIDRQQYLELSETLQDNYSLAITIANAPVLLGSLSAFGVINGGINYSVGDLVKTSTGGRSAQAIVVSTESSSGKVSFDLIAGGFGFSLNAIVTVTSTSGSGASFNVGSIADIQVYNINTDVIDGYYSTQLDFNTSGIDIDINDASGGSMTVGENITGSANSVCLDVTPISGAIVNNDVLVFTNSSYGTVSLLAYSSDHSLLYVTGTESNLNQANLIPGVQLTSNNGAVVQINTNFGESIITGNAVVLVANSTVIAADYVNGYFIANSTITGQTSGATANVQFTHRLTNWNFPGSQFANSNLDGLSIGQILVSYSLDVGTITSLANVNPGSGYFGNPTISIVEPLIYDLGISDGMGGYYGFDANVVGTAEFANGIVTALRVVDSSFAFNPGEIVSLQGANNSSSITAAAVVDLAGTGQGYYLNNIGFSSDLSYLQDSNYWQVFSYEVLAHRMLSTYQTLVEKLVHPSGMALFGRYVDYNELTTETSMPEYFSINT